MRQIHYSVSLNKSAKKQALDVITRLRAIMPIARVHMLISVIVPTERKPSVSLYMNTVRVMPYSSCLTYLLFLLFSSVLLQCLRRWSSC